MQTYAVTFVCVVIAGIDVSIVLLVFHFLYEISNYQLLFLQLFLAI